MINFGNDGCLCSFLISITEAQKLLNVFHFFSRIIIPHSIFHIFILQTFSGSSSLRRTFRHLAPPENKSPSSFQSVFFFFANYSNCVGGGVIAGQSEGTYFSLIFSQKHHLAQRGKVFPGCVSHSFRIISSVCVQTSINTRTS